MNIIEEIYVPNVEQQEINTSEFNKDPVLLLENYKLRLRKHLTLKGVRITDVTAVVELLKSSSIDYQRAYAHLLLENYGVPARIVPNATDKDMQSYGLSDEMIAYIKANGRCEEDKIRFIGHSQGEFDNTDRKAPTSPDTQNVFHPIQVDESAVKSSTLAFWEDALKSLQSQLGEATDEGVKTSLEKDIMKAKEQISQLQK